MPPTALLLVLTFLESLGTILVERAAYFYCHERLGFSDALNLWLALAFGAAYVCGAMLSHAASRALGERRVLLASVAAQAPIYAALAGWPSAGLMFAGSTTLGFLCGLKWPVVESYVSAGHAPLATARAIGRFNLSWAVAVPLSLAISGPLIAWRSWALFAAGAAISLVSAALVAMLAARPAHLPADHPGRPDAAGIARLTGLLASARWLMLGSYSAMWILASLMPGIFASLKVDVAWSTALSGTLDVTRLGAFAALGAWTAWHGRRWPLVQAMVLLPVGFLLVLAGRSLPTVLAGEVLFGWAAGAIYYAALYYAMVVKNASVAGSGGHESLIGAGFALGPAAGLAGVALQDAAGSQLVGVLAVAAVLLVLCGAAAAGRLLRLGRPAVAAKSGGGHT